MRFLTLLVCFILCGPAVSQGVDQYLKLRRTHGITAAAGVAALEAFVGHKTVEVQGTVRGSFRVGPTLYLLLERTDGETISVAADKAPEWLADGNATRARLLIRARRSTEMEEIQARLIGASPDAPISALELSEARKRAEAKRKADAEAARRAASRAKGKGALSGPIGMGNRKSPPRNWNLPASDATPYYAAFIRGQNRRLSDADAWKIAEGIIGFSLQYGVDARLIMAMVMVESGFRPDATSRAGAMGLGQLMPGTARGLGITDAYDKMQNLYGTVRVIRGHLERFQARTGDGWEALVLSLAAYNAGPGAVRRHGGVPPFRETQNYIRKVTELYEQFRR